MKRIAIVMSLVSSSFLFANESINIIKGSAYGENVVSENSSVSFERKSKKYYEREVLFNYIQITKGLNQKPYEAQKIALINKVEEPVIEESKNDDKGVESIAVVGYCNVGENIHIGKQPSSGYFDCNTNIGYVKVFGELTPVNEMATLIYDPKYIDYKDTRFKVLDGARTTNEERTSYNVATFVNDRKISEIALTSTISATEDIRTSSHEYLKALEESKKKENTDYIISNNNIVPVNNKNTEKPDASDYIVKAGIDIVSGIVKTTAEVFKKDLPYLYEIRKNSKIYLDIKIDKNGEKLKWKK